MIKYQVPDGRVLVRVGAVPEKTESGIFIPDAAQDKSCTGVVLASGTFDYAQGDMVAFGKYSGTSLAHVAPEFKDTLLFYKQDLLGTIHAAEGVEITEPAPAPEA